MKKTNEEIQEIVEDTLEEYFSLTGPSLPTGTGVAYSDIGPFSQYVRSAADILDTLCDAIERKTGFKSLQRTRKQKPIPPQDRKNTKVKIK